MRYLFHILFILCGLYLSAFVQRFFISSKPSTKWDLYQQQIKPNLIDDIHHHNYERRLTRITEHNTQHHSFILSENEFTHLSDEEIRSNLLNSVLSESPQSSQTYHNTSFSGSLDWRDFGAVTSVKHQGYCGSCYAFAIAATIEGARKIAGYPLTELSVQDIIDCSEEIGNRECLGGFETISYDYVMSHGIASWKSCPYEDHWHVNWNIFHPNGNHGCNNVSRYTDIIGYSASIFNGTEEALRDAVDKGPVAAAINAAVETFWYYGGGVYRDLQCVDNFVNHLIVVIGYGTDPEFGDYWIIKNSWGKKWGEKGYMRLARNVDGNCGIGHRFAYPIIRPFSTS